MLRMLMFSDINWNDVFKEAVIAKTYEESIKKIKENTKSNIRNIIIKVKIN